MSKLRLASILAFSLILSFVARAQGNNPRRPSTPDEQNRFVALTHNLEQNPLDRKLDHDVQWAIRWLIEVPDVHASVCTAVLGDFWGEKKYKYTNKIATQMTLSGAAFTIEEPTQSNDRVAQFNAGVKGALNAYQAILKQQPGAHSESLDRLVQKQTDGTLADFVRDAAAKGCK